MIISKTPLRISFVGGGTDLPDFHEDHGVKGRVISATIDKYIYVTANRKFDNKIRVSYSKTELVDNVEQVEHNIIREALKLVGIVKSVEIVCTSDLPIAGGGSGLGSSSALAVGVLKALYALNGEHVPAERLANEAYNIERKVLGLPVGKQDHYAAAFGGLNLITFDVDGAVAVDPVICAAGVYASVSEKLLMFYTGISRASSSILVDQAKNTNLHVNRYIDLANAALDFHDALVKGDLEHCYQIMREGWSVKKKLATNISNQQIDTWYDAAINAGALAGKIAGAGGGGFLFFLGEKDVHSDIKGVLSDLLHLKCEITRRGSHIIHVS